MYDCFNNVFFSFNGRENENLKLFIIKGDIKDIKKKLHVHVLVYGELKIEYVNTLNKYNNY